MTIPAAPGPYVDWLPPLPLHRPPHQSVDGPLRGVRLAVKDVFDVAGLPTGAGNPTWLDTHSPATRDAAAVAALTGAGAQIVGKTHTDELAYSLFGTNAHYGAQDNPAAPGHLTGGSSNGTAAAVAAGTAELGLGTDTGGSIRIPAAWCGLYGLRPTHTRVSRDGIVLLGPSFDVPGLLAADLRVLRTAARVLLTGAPRVDPIRQLVVPPDLWKLAEPAVRDALIPAVTALGTLLPIRREPLFASTGQVPDYRLAYSVRQGFEFWRLHADWITEHQPKFGPGIAARVKAASGRDVAELAAADQEIAALRETVLPVLASALLVLPSAPVPAPARDGRSTAALRAPILGLTGPASVLGLPALSLPVATVAGRPIGLCLVGAPGTDEALLELAEQWRLSQSI